MGFRHPAVREEAAEAKTVIHGGGAPAVAELARAEAELPASRQVCQGVLLETAHRIFCASLFAGSFAS